MKKLILVLAISLALMSCNRPAPVIGDASNPYIVVKVQYYTKDNCRYIGTLNASTSNNWLNVLRPAVILPRGMYNVGDTITPNNFK
jgi:hypothetical protein